MKYRFDGILPFTVFTALLINQVIQINADICKSKPDERSTFLWSIRSRDSERLSFLFGTIHVAYDRVWNSVSIKLKEVLNQIDTLVLEIALHDPQTVNKLIECKQLGPNQTLQQLLPSSLYLRLKHYFANLRQHKYPKSNSTLSIELNQQLNFLINAWEQRRPVWLLFMLYQMGEEQQKQSNVPMLDAYLAHKSQQIGKQLHSIETPEEQCNPLISIDSEQVIFAINYTLSYLEWNRRNPHRFVSKKPTIEDLIELYKCGNLQVTRLEGWRLQESGFTLNEELDKQAKRVDEQLKHDIIDQRNARMAMRAHNLMKDNPKRSFLFALGAGHFHGQYSLINILKNYGYVVEPITNASSIYSDGSNFKNFNALWIRNNEKSWWKQDGDSIDDGRSYYIWIILLTILLFVVITHKLSQYLLRVINKPKLYNQVSVLPTFL